VRETLFTKICWSVCIGENSGFYLKMVQDSTTKKETLIFTEMTTKSGMGKNGKPYTRFTLIDEEGRKFNTFDTKYTKLTIPQEINYTETPKEFENEQGKLINYIQRDIVDAPQSPVSPASNQDTQTPPPLKRTQENASQSFTKDDLHKFGLWLLEEVKKIVENSERITAKETEKIAEEVK